MNCSIGIWFVVIAVVLIVLYWILSNLAVMQPPPPRPDADLQRLLYDFQSYPTELWFRNNTCIFRKYLQCKIYRYIIYESNGRVVYDSKPDYPSNESAKELRNSVEYIQTMTVTQAGVIRGNTNNAAFLAKIGNRFRVVHISEYIYTEKDVGF